MLAVGLILSSMVMVWQYIDGVATGIRYTVAAGDCLGTGESVAHITYKSHYRNSAVVCFIGNYRYICCRNIADALNSNRNRIAGRGIDIVINGDGLGNTLMVFPQASVTL